MLFFKLYPDAWRAGVCQLTPEERGIYDTVINVLYAYDGALPPDTDDKWWSRECNCNPRTWVAIRDRLVAKGKLFYQNGRLMAKGVQETIEQVGAFSEKQSKRARIGAECRSNASRMQVEFSEKSNENNEANQPIQITDNIEQITENKDARSARSEEEFEEFWKVYPKREGPNPRKPASSSFRRALGKGASAAEIIEGARRLANSAPAERRFIPQAVTWLNQERWKDNSDAPSPVNITHIGFYAPFGSPEQDAWDAYGRATKGITYPRDKRGGWAFPTRWPPNFAAQEGNA